MLSFPNAELCLSSQQPVYMSHRFMVNSGLTQATDARRRILFIVAI